MVSQISSPIDIDPILVRWLDAQHRLGLPTSDLYDLKNQYGTTIGQITQSTTNRTRQSTASAYVEVNIARTNLHVLLNARVTRVLFDKPNGMNPIASGVEFYFNNRVYQVNK